MAPPPTTNNPITESASDPIATGRVVTAPTQDPLGTPTSSGNYQIAMGLMQA